ncbi:MAG: hypothetical protein EPO28_11660 [Saprospiraceae bacterium]|nr:MAG: hypothetical protein EPO28_11660 [Saprospiraceae bacterium]
MTKPPIIAAIEQRLPTPKSVTAFLREKFDEHQYGSYGGISEEQKKQGWEAWMSSLFATAAKSRVGLHEAPALPAGFPANLMAVKYGQPRYAFDEQGRLTGLNLAGLGLEDAQWKAIVKLLDEAGVRLKALNVSENRLVRFVPPAGVEALKVLDIAENPLEEPPPEIIKQGNAAILDHFRRMKEQGSSAIYEAKLLILGEGGAGKTSLCRKLQDPANPLPEERETTKGIDVHVLHFPMKNGGQFRMNVWDFGGQEIYHATHQFFLNKRSLYVLLDDTRKDDKSVYDPAFRYWLQVCELLGGNSPLLIVQNEKGDRSKSLDLRSMKGHFGFVSGSLPTNLLTCRGLDKVRAEIEHLISSLPHVGTPLPKQWVVIREDVERLTAKKEFISEDEWLALCAERQVDEEQALQLSQYFHDIGVFLHFQDDALLRLTIILQKDWATNAAYRVLDDETVKQQNKGRFTEADLQRIWHEPHYHRRLPELLALLLKFELCYPIPDVQPQQWLVPQLLPVSQPDYEWPGNTDWQSVLQYRYDFMPKGLLGRIVVRLHRFVARPDLAWQRGALLERLGAQAEVVETPGEKDTIRIRVYSPSLGGGRGEAALRKELLVIVAEEFDKLHGTFERLRVEKLIPCICEKCVASADPHFYEYSKLLKRRQARQRTVNCENSYKDVVVLALLDGVGAGGQDGDFPGLRDLESLSQRKDEGLPKEKTPGKQSEIKGLIANNDIAEAIKMLRESLGGNTAIALENQWTQLRQDETRGIMSYENTTLRRNQIIQALLQLAEQVR